MSRELNVTAVEQLDFRLGAAVVNGLCHNPDVSRRVDDGLVAESHCVQVQRRDFGPQFDNVLDALKRWQKVGARSGDSRIVVARMVAAPRPGGQIQDKRVVFCAD